MKFTHKNISCLIAVLSLFVFGCVPQKNIVYFQPKQNDTSKFVVPVRPDMIIYPKDIINVFVYTDNPDALPGIGSKLEDRSMDNRPAYERGFTVEDNGDLVLPLIGAVKIAGLTVDSAKRVIAKRYSAYITNPVVQLKKLNFKITVLGEVKEPGMYFISYESLTLLEGLATAGDIGLYGSRNDVKVIRTINGKQEEYTVDLTDQSSLYSKYFYLKQDDVIYVRQLKNKRWQNITPQISVITSVSAVLIAFATLLIVKANK